MAVALLSAVPISASAQDPAAAPEGAVDAATAAAPSGPIDLSLEGAIERGLRENLGVLLAAGRVEQAEGERRQARSALLPQLGASVGQSRQKINLEAYGIPVAPGESPLIGPYNVYDLRLSMALELVDLSASARARAAREQRDASRLTFDQARERVVAAVADLYLGVLASEARIEAARAQVESAESAAAQAATRKEAGTAAGIDVLRAQVRLAAERQRLIEAENRSAKQRLALAQAVGLPLDRPLHLTASLRFAPPRDGAVDAALARARSDRPDLAAARTELAAARSALSAARRQRLPSLAAHADYGPIGNSPPSAENTYTLALGVHLPLFEGGRIGGEVQAAEGRVAAAAARLADLERQVERDVRGALLDVASAAQQVTVADQARDLAARQLAQARDRFSSGVADNLEVVQAQQDVADANERYVSSLYDYNRARVDLALAEGAAEHSAPEFLTDVVKGEAR